MPDPIVFKFKNNDLVSHRMGGNGRVVWLQEDGQFAVEVDRKKYGMGPWTNKLICWEEWEKVA